MRGFYSEKYNLVCCDHAYYIPDKIIFNKRKNKYKALIAGQMKEVTVIQSNKCLKNLLQLKETLEEEQIKKLRLLVEERNNCNFDINLTSKGRSIYAAEKFEENEFLLEYKGELLTRSDGLKKEKEYAKSNLGGGYIVFFNYNNRYLCIDATKESYNLGRLVNHSTHPNSALKKFRVDEKIRLFLYAIKTIKPGEEITFDYNERRNYVCKILPWLTSNDQKESSKEKLFMDEKSSQKLHKLDEEMKLLRSEKRNLKLKLEALQKESSIDHFKNNTFENHEIITFSKSEIHLEEGETQVSTTPDYIRKVNPFSNERGTNSKHRKEIVSSTPIDDSSRITLEYSALDLSEILFTKSSIKNKEEAHARATTNQKSKVIAISNKENINHVNEPIRKVHEVKTSSKNNIEGQIQARATSNKKRKLSATCSEKIVCQEKESAKKDNKLQTSSKSGKGETHARETTNKTKVIAISNKMNKNHANESIRKVHEVKTSSKNNTEGEIHARVTSNKKRKLLAICSDENISLESESAEKDNQLEISSKSGKDSTEKDMRLPYCMYCKEHQTQFARHLIIHKNEKYVKRYFAAKTKKQKTRIITYIRNLGYGLLEKLTGKAIPVKSLRYGITTSKEKCDMCTGRFSKETLRKHRLYCYGNDL